jgi:hypothetical protein
MAISGTGDVIFAMPADPPAPPIPAKPPAARVQPEL